MINIGIGISWAKAIYSVANNVIANFKARVLSYPNSIFEAGPCLDATLEGLNAKGLLDNASLIITPNAYNTGILYDVVPNTTLGDMTVVRATTATRVNSSGLIESVAINVPRLDYLNASCPSLLVEPQRTNSILYSEQFDNATWTKRDATVTSNNINSPSGLLNADFIIPNTTNTVHSLNNSTANVTSGLCTYSIFAKKGLYKNILVWFDIHSGGIGVNLETLAIFRNTNITSYKIDNYGNEWVRISITANIVATALPAIYIYSNDTTPQISWAANGTGGLYVWGAQVEKTSSYATSYIPTVASTVTRNADVISKTGISSLIGQTEGTIFCEWENKLETRDRRLLSLRNNNTNSDYILFTIFSNNIINVGILVSGVSVITALNISPLSIGIHKLALTYDLNTNGVLFYLDGFLIATKTATALPILSEIGLGILGTTTANALGSGIYNVSLYKTALTDTEMTQLTTL
jgi:hypothetical protein